MKHILRCTTCHSYTMMDAHCGKKSVSPAPAKWSPEDKYGKYRLEARKEGLKEKGLL